MHHIARLKVAVVAVTLILAGRLIFALIFGRIWARGEWRRRGAGVTFWPIVRTEAAWFTLLMLPAAYTILRLPAALPRWFRYLVSLEVITVAAVAIGYVWYTARRERRRDAAYVESQVSKLFESGNGGDARLMILDGPEANHG